MQHIFCNASVISLKRRVVDTSLQFVVTAVIMFWKRNVQPIRARWHFASVTFGLLDIRNVGVVVLTYIGIMAICVTIGISIFNRTLPGIFLLIPH